MTSLGARRMATLRDGAVVSSAQGAGAVFRFAFQLLLARAFAPSAFAEIAVALSWSQIVAAASGGGGGALLLTTLPRLELEHPGAAQVMFRRTMTITAITAVVVAGAIAAGLAAAGLAGGALAGCLVLATTPLRALLIATQEALRGLGDLAFGQVLTLVIQPALSGLVVGALAAGRWGATDPRVAAAALFAGLVATFLPGWRRALRAMTPAVADAAGAVAPPLGAFVRFGASSALLVWMFEGPLVLAGIAIADSTEVAVLNVHLRLSMATALAAVAVSTLASAHWARTAAGGPPARAAALRWSAAGAGAAAIVVAVLFAAGSAVMYAFGEAYTFRPALLAGLVVKDLCLAAAGPLFYFLALHRREDLILRSSVLGGMALLAAMPLAAVFGAAGSAWGAAVGGAVWLIAYLVSVLSQ